MVAMQAALIGSALAVVIAGLAWQLLSRWRQLIAALSYDGGAAVTTVRPLPIAVRRLRAA